MKKFILNLLIGLLIFPVFSQQIKAAEFDLFAGYTPTEVQTLFTKYGFHPEQSDTDWWGQNRKNAWGDLEYNLARRVKLASAPMTFDQTYLGAAIPQVIALFETSLQAKITSSATALTLVDGTDKAGNTLSGNYGFIINEGASNEEFVSCQCTGTACTSCLRGVSPVTGNTEVAALKFEHRRGESVKLTDFPVLGVMKRVLNGEEGLPNTIYYDTDNTATASSTAIATKGYVDSVAMQGGVTSTEALTGIVQLGTQQEMASTTFDVDVPTVLSTKYSTSSPDVRGIYVPVSENDGYLNQGWLDLSEDFTWTGEHTFNATSTIENLIVTGNASGVTVFGGTGLDGALTTTATTTINLGSAAYVVKNYSSIDIEAGEGLAFSNPHVNGSIIVIKSTGNCNIAGMIDADSMGAGGGAGGGDNGDGSYGVITNGIGGGRGDNESNADAAPGAQTAGTYFLPNISGKLIKVTPGAGGGEGGNSNVATGGDGGRGGGALIIECGGNWNFSGVISAKGGNGIAGGGGGGAGGGGGGGAGGSIAVIYNTLVANTGVYLINGGNGGNGGTSTSRYGGGGGAGGSNLYYGGAGGDSGSNGANGGGSAGGIGGTGGGGTTQGGGGGGGGSTGIAYTVLNTEF